MAKIDRTYRKILETIINKCFEYEDPNRKGVKRLQIPSYTFEHDFKDGFPAITTKKLYWKGVVGELLWFLRGDTNIKYLIDNDINIWNKDAYNYYKLFDPGEDLKITQFLKNLGYGYRDGSYIRGDLGRVYGAQWRDWKGDEYKYVDQIYSLIEELKENPMGTRHIVTAWNPAELDKMALPPCHWSFEILVEPYESDLDRWRQIMSKSEFKFKFPNYKKQYQFTLKWHQRSVDTFLGLPFNIASYALLAQIIGKMTNMIPKGVIGDLSNVHIYEPHLNAVKEQLSRDIHTYGECELEIDNKFDKCLADYNFKNNNFNLDDLLNELKIGDFKLKGYESYLPIKADMLAYNK